MSRSMATFYRRQWLRLCDRNFHFLNSNSCDKQFNSFFSIQLSSRTRLLTPGHKNPNRSDSNQSHRSEMYQSRDENRTQNYRYSAALPIIRCAPFTELSRSLISRNFEFRKQKLRSFNLSHCLYRNKQAV